MKGPTEPLLGVRQKAESFKILSQNCPDKSLVVDLGAQPFILSCAAKLTGYEVVAVNVEPEKYLKIARDYMIKL